MRLTPLLPVLLLAACSTKNDDGPGAASASASAPSPSPSASANAGPPASSDAKPSDSPSPSLVHPLPGQKLTTVDSAPSIPGGVGIVYVGMTEIQFQEEKLVALKNGELAPSDLQEHLVPRLFDALSAQPGAGAPDSPPRKLLLAVDERVPFSTLVNIMFTAGRAQFSSYALLVETEDQRYAALPVEPPNFAFGGPGPAPTPTPVNVTVGADGYRYRTPPPPDALDAASPLEAAVIAIKAPEAPLSQLDRWDVAALAATAKATKSAQPAYDGFRISAEPEVPVGALLQATAALRGSKCTEAETSTCIFTHAVVTAGPPKAAPRVKFKGVYGGE